MVLIPSIKTLTDRVEARNDASRDQSRHAVNQRIWAVLRGAAIAREKHAYFFREIQRERSRRSALVRKTKL